MLNLSEIERALDKHELWAAMAHGRYWKLRRNGKTQLWKTRPSESCGEINQRSNVGTSKPCDFVISANDPNAAE